MEIVNELEKSRKKLLIKLFIAGGSVSLVFFYGFIKLCENAKIIPLLFLVFIHIFVIFGLKFSVTNSFIKTLNETIFKALDVKDIKFLRNSQNLKKIVLNFAKPKIGLLMSNDEFSGVLNGVKFSICDAELFFGKVKFKGKIFNAKLKKDYGVKILITNLGIISHKNLDEIKLDSAKFSDNFRVFSDDLKGAFYLLTPVFIERLEILVGDKKADILLFDDEILLILDNKIDALEPNLFSKIRALNTQNFINQIKSFSDLIKFLRLNYFFN